MDELVLLAVNGDREAFGKIIQVKKESLYRMAFIYVKNEDDALDIVNEAVCRAFISIRKLKSPEFFSTWLTRILINCALDYIKKKKILLPLNEAIASDKNTSDYDELIDLYSAVDRLQGKYKTVIMLKYFEDLKITEISNVLECPTNTVKTYLHRALEILRIDLGKEDIDE